MGRGARNAHRCGASKKYGCPHVPLSSTTGVATVGKNSGVVSQSASIAPKPPLRRALNDVVGGGAASVLTVTFGLSYALLIFTGPLAPYLSYGAGLTFISSAVLAATIALVSSLPFAVAVPESSTAAMTGILASSLGDR